jgi:uncharacterized alpha/beta hydrolase family protein
VSIPGKEEVKMIRWTRSAKVSSAKNMPKAVQWAKEVAEFITKKYKIQVSVYMDSFGDVGTIRWFCDYEDLAAVEKLGKQLIADQEYLKRLAETDDLFMQGSVYDTVMQAI